MPASRHRKNHLALKAGLAAVGIEYATQSGHELPQLNAVRIPTGIDDAVVRKGALERFGIEIGAVLGAQRQGLADRADGLFESADECAVRSLPWSSCWRSKGIVSTTERRWRRRMRCLGRHAIRCRPRRKHIADPSRVGGRTRSHAGSVVFVAPAQRTGLCFCGATVAPILWLPHFTRANDLGNLAVPRSRILAIATDGR